MPRLHERDLLEELETGEGGSPYMGVSDEDWAVEQKEMSTDLDSLLLEERFECFRCRDSGFGIRPGLHCSCRFGTELRSVEYLDVDIYDMFD